MSDSPPRTDRTKVDRELERQLDAAKGTDTPVEAVLMVRGAEDPTTDVSRQARDALERVERSVGRAPDVVNVLANLGLIVVSAPERFVRALVDQPEFDSAVANSDVDAVAPSRSKRDGE